MSTALRLLAIDDVSKDIRVPETSVDTYKGLVTLDDATGNQDAFEIAYTVNKATSGTATGLKITPTETSVPGAHYAIEIGGTGQVLLPSVNSPLAPTLAFGDGDSGFYEKAANEIRIALNGLTSFKWTSAEYAGTAGTGPAMQNETMTATNPGFTPAADKDTGWGTAGPNKFSIIAGGVEGLRVENNTSGATGNHTFIPNLTTAPSSSATGGGYLYTEAGALKYRGSGGTITTLGVA